MKKYAFGVDVGGTTCKLGLFEINGELINKWEIKTNIADNGSTILDDIVKTIHEKLRETRISKQDVLGVGIGVPGPVLDDGTVRKCVNLGWGSFNIENELSKKIDLPVKAGNDANVATLGEMWQGGGKGYKNVVMITLGTGIGGGIVINGKIINGAYGAAGEIGHMKMTNNESRICGCGKSGCLEQYASATGIVNMAKQELVTNDEESVLRSLTEITAKDIFNAAKSGDKLAGELLDRLGEMLGTALANVSCIVDPEIFVIGGGVSKAGQFLLEVIQKHFKEKAFHASVEAKFALASLGNDAGIYGCVQLVLSV